MNNHSNNYKDLINYTEIKRKRFTLKLRLNSNNTSIESINIENEGNNNIKKLKKEYILFRPILPICYILKKSNYKNKFIHTVKNKNYFSTKENYIMSQKYLDKNIYSINIDNKMNEKTKTNQIFQKINLTKALTPIVKNNKKKIINFNEYKKEFPYNKSSYKNIKDNIRKKILSINKVKSKRNKKMINNTFLKKTKKCNKTSMSSSGFLIDNNTFNNKMPLLDINDTDRDIIKKINKEKIIFVRNENNNKYHMIGFLKHKGNINKCPKCLEMMKKIKSNNILNNDNINNYENENIKIKYIRNNSENKKILNKKLIDFCRKDEINKIKLINNDKKYNIERNSIFWEYSKSNKAKKTNLFKKYFSSYNVIKNKSLKKRKRDFIDYFSNNDSIIKDNFTFLLKNEFPIINSYFHKQK